MIVGLNRDHTFPDLFKINDICVVLPSHQDFVSRLPVAMTPGNDVEVVGVSGCGPINERRSGVDWLGCQPSGLGWGGAYKQ